MEMDRTVIYVIIVNSPHIPRMVKPNKWSTFKTISIPIILPNPQKSTNIPILINKFILLLSSVFH